MLEVLRPARVGRRSDRYRIPTSDWQVIPILEAAGGEPMGVALLAAARKHEDKVLECTRELSPKLLQKLAEHDLNDSEVRTWIDGGSTGRSHQQWKLAEHDLNDSEVRPL